MAWTQAFIVIVFMWSIWAGIRDAFLTAIRAISRIAVLFGADYKNR